MAARTATCWPSWSSLRSTPPAAGRSRTPDTSSAPTATAWRGSRMSYAWATTRSSRSCLSGHAPARRARARPCRPGRPSRHRVQPHRDPPAARGAAPSALGPHVRQAGSYVGPDKLRFDFTHGKALTPEELHDVEDAVNPWILESHPVRALTTTLPEARRFGAMALFGEKYGDVVRMVEVGDGSFSRELCGGTHVRNTAEVGLFKVLGETSSAANVRRIEAITGPDAVQLMRATIAPWRRRPHSCGCRLTGFPRRCPSFARACASWSGGRGGANRTGPSTSSRSPRRRPRLDGARVLVAAVPAQRQGAARDRRSAEVQARRRGDRARERGGGPRRPDRQRRSFAGRARRARRGDRQGGSGRSRRRRRRPDTLARAGGRDPAKLPEAIDRRPGGDRGCAARLSWR